MSYLWHMLVMINIYAILAMSLNVVVGYTGLLSLCHAAFYGLGAYLTTLLVMKASWPFVGALAAAALVTGLLALIVALPSLRLRGDYFVLATLGFQIIVFSILYNWVGVTGGSHGITAIPRPRVLGYEISTVFRYFVFSSVIAGGCGLVLWRMLASPFGRMLRAVREDEVAASALGKNVPYLRTLAFVLGAAFAAIPGGLFAGYLRYIDPNSFTLMEAIFILAIVVIGGAGRFVGPILGAAFMVILPEALRSLQVSDASAGHIREIIYGLLLIALMRVRPRGLVGEYGFD